MSSLGWSILNFARCVINPVAARFLHSARRHTSDVASPEFSYQALPRLNLSSPLLPMSVALSRRIKSIAMNRPEFLGRYLTLQAACYVDR